MSSMENIEVYIPKGACVKNIPFQSLSSSISRKISVHLNRSDTPEKQIVTCISPVELREKAVDDVLLVGQRSCVTKITPGQFWLPVVSSSLKAYKILKSILTAHQPPIQLTGPESEAASFSVSKASFLQKNSLFVFNNQIFLSVKKSRGRVSSQNLTSPSAFPVSPSQQHQQKAPPRCQTQDTPPRPQQRTVAGKTSGSTNSPPKPSGEQEPNQEAQMSNSEPKIPHQSQSTAHTSPEVSEEAEAAGGEGETHQHLETAEFLPRTESCLAFDFQLLAKEEKIDHLRARLRQKEAALSMLKSKSTDQV